jgi:hypothetical protein
MRFERQKRIVSWDKRAQQLWGRRASTAAGIYTTTTETVHKSTFALMGHAVPVSALPRLPAFPLPCGRSEH